MTIIASESQVIDADALGPDAIVASVSVMVDRLLDKATARGIALDWSTARMQITPAPNDDESRLLLEAEVLR